jgi:nucleoside-diphosphate-sugar epimerase
MFGDGKTYYHPLYIDNLVDSLLLAQEDGKGDGEAYLIADEEYVEIEDLVRRVGQALDVDVRIRHFPIAPVVVAGHVCEKLCKPFKITPPIFPRRVDWYRQDRAFNIDKAKRDLGYEPRVGLDEGLRKTAEWYRDQGYL